MYIYILYIHISYTLRSTLNMAPRSFEHNALFTLPASAPRRLPARFMDFIAAIFSWPCMISKSRWRDVTWDMVSMVNRGEMWWSSRRFHGFCGDLFPLRLSFFGGQFLLDHVDHLLLFFLRKYLSWLGDKGTNVAYGYNSCGIHWIVFLTVDSVDIVCGKDDYYISG